MDYKVYILYSALTDGYYIGVSSEVEMRLNQHLNPIHTKYTSRAGDWTIFLVLNCQSKTHALRLEKFIKKMKSKRFIQSLKEDEFKRNSVIIKTASES
jgi:putative endonuclease